MLQINSTVRWKTLLGNIRCCSSQCCISLSVKCFPGYEDYLSLMVKNIELERVLFPWLTPMPHSLDGFWQVFSLLGHLQKHNNNRANTHVSLALQQSQSYNNWKTALDFSGFLWVTRKGSTMHCSVPSWIVVEWTWHHAPHMHMEEVSVTHKNLLWFQIYYARTLQGCCLKAS